MQNTLTQLITKTLKGVTSISIKEYNINNYPELTNYIPDSWLHFYGNGPEDALVRADINIICSGDTPLASIDLLTDNFDPDFTRIYLDPDKSEVHIINLDY